MSKNAVEFFHDLAELVWPVKGAAEQLINGIEMVPARVFEDAGVYKKVPGAIKTLDGSNTGTIELIGLILPIESAVEIRNLLTEMEASGVLTVRQKSGIIGQQRIK